MFCKKILIIGNLGYVGSALVNYMKRNFDGVVIHGFDSGYFSSNIFDPYWSSDHFIDLQLYGDVRNINSKIFKNGYDSVIYLAALANDPMGNVYEMQSEDINTHSAITCAKFAKSNGIHNFVFASSCSVYGAGGSSSRNEDDTINPLTTYANSKILSEIGLKDLADKSFNVTCLRFATACGMSPRLRLDLVLSDFVANAKIHKKIKILSDGSPLRPLIDVQDMSNAIWWASNKFDTNIPYLIINVGRNSWNFKIIELAELVNEVIGGVEIEVNSASQPDLRSYLVDFSKFEKLNNTLGSRSIRQTIIELYDFVSKTIHNLNDIYKSEFIRLNQLKNLQLNGSLDKDLRWSL